MSDVINIPFGTFGQTIRNGDMIGIANVVQYLRKDNKQLKFYIQRNNIQQTDYCLKFYDFLCENTSYFSTVPGDKDLSWKNVNVWDFRDISGDQVSIRNKKEIENKIVVFPVLDAPYNTYRNWPKDLLQSILKESSTFYEKKILCVKEQIDNLDLHGFEISTDFMTNIEHIMTCHTFVGGDTGTSHFASALNRGPIDLVYYYSSRGLIHTMPFYLLDGKGTIKTYWGNFEGTTW
jgi:hypothetical protein